jgi:hypothetical protein
MTPVTPDPRPDTGAPVLRLPCLDENRAKRFDAWLLMEEVDTRGVDGLHVLIPTTYPPFAWEVAEAAVSNGFAADDAVCAAVGSFLTSAGVR